MREASRQSFTKATKGYQGITKSFDKKMITRKVRPLIKSAQVLGKQISH